MTRYSLLGWVHEQRKFVWDTELLHLAALSWFKDVRDSSALAVDAENRARVAHTVKFRYTPWLNQIYSDCGPMKQRQAVRGVQPRLAPQWPERRW